MGDGINWNEWVAVKKSPFKAVNAEKSKFLFNVAWNDVELKFAITCQKHHRVARDKELTAWATLLALQDLIYVHQQLTLINHNLNLCLPHLPPSPRKLWSYKSSPSPFISPELCVALEFYLKNAVEMCGLDLVIELVFDDKLSESEKYYEDVNELERESYEKQLDNALKELNTVLAMRENAENMLQMVSIYTLEDNVINDVSKTLAALFSYQLQPFLDLRELAFSKLRAARVAMESEDLGPRVKEQLRREYIEWQIEYTHAIDNIRQLYLEYYRRSNEILKAQKTRMGLDRERFGRATFEALASARLDRLEISSREENLKWLRAKRLDYEHKMDKTQHELISVKSEADVDRVESDVYKRQLDVFDIRLDIISEEEQLIRKRIAILNKQRMDASEIGVYFDTVETEDQIKEMENNEELMTTSRRDEPEMVLLKQKLASVSCRRAKLRNRRNACVAVREKQIQERVMTDVRTKTHHAIHLKREAKKKLEDEEKERVLKERKNTLHRLRNYHLRYPAPKALRNRVQVEENEESRDDNETNKREEKKMDKENVIEIKMDAQNKIDVPPPPPPPPLPSCPPPPPLPPPPPPPPASMSSKLSSTIQLSRPSGITSKPIDDVSSSAISLSAVLDAKSRLKRTRSVDVSIEDKLNEVLNVRNHLSTNPSGDDMTKMLKEAMQRIRPLVAQSDDDSSDTAEDDADFD